MKNILCQYLKFVFILFLHPFLKKLPPIVLTILALFSFHSISNGQLNQYTTKIITYYKDLASEYLKFEKHNYKIRQNETFSISPDGMFVAVMTNKESNSSLTSVIVYNQSGEIIKKHFVTPLGHIVLANDGRFITFGNDEENEINLVNKVNFYSNDGKLINRNPLIFGYMNPIIKFLPNETFIMLVSSDETNVKKDCKLFFYDPNFLKISEQDIALEREFERIISLKYDPTDGFIKVTKLTRNKEESDEKILIFDSKGNLIKRNE